MASSVKKIGKSTRGVRGPEPKYLKLEGNWEDRMRESLRAKPMPKSAKSKRK